MTIVVSATDKQWNDLNRDGEKADWQRVDDTSQFDQFKEADAFFSLKDNSIPDDFADLKKPVFINSVIETLSDLNAPENIFRINGWATFLSRTAWEIAGKVDEQCRRVFHALNIKINPVPDEPGFISARVIAMIINEAYFAVEEQVSSREEIDTAMKLGTNYPLGPFDWAQKIGIQNISALLQKLNTTDRRYQPSELLLKEAGSKEQ